VWGHLFEDIVMSVYGKIKRRGHTTLQRFFINDSPPQ
ncbi:MAG: hypothetical protein ACI909_004265, partial [Planctomycetota bacterium]